MEQDELDALFRPIKQEITSLEYTFKQISLPVRREELYQLYILAENARDWQQARAALITAYVEKQDGETMQRLMTQLQRKELHLTEALEELDEVKKRNRSVTQSP